MRKPKNKTKTELNDWGLAEYKRSGFGELIRGKYATSQVDFHQLTGALLACIGEDEGMKFMHHSTVIASQIASLAIGRMKLITPIRSPCVIG